MYKASTKPVTLSVPTPYEHAIGYTFTYKCITREPKCVYSRIRYTYGFIPSTSDVTRPAPTRDLLKQTPTSIRTHARAVSAPRPRHVACECKKNSRRAVDDFSHCTVGTRPPETPSEICIESMMLARLGRVRQPPLPGYRTVALQVQRSTAGCARSAKRVVLDDARRSTLDLATVSGGG